MKFFCLPGHQTSYWFPPLSVWLMGFLAIFPMLAASVVNVNRNGPSTTESNHGVHVYWGPAIMTVTYCSWYAEFTLHYYNSKATTKQQSVFFSLYWSFCPVKPYCMCSIMVLLQSKNYFQICFLVSCFPVCKFFGGNILLPHLVGNLYTFLI